MKIQWFGNSHFLVTTDKGIRIAIDPFQYNIIVEDAPLPAYGNSIRDTFHGPADVVTMSHGHFDHSYLWAIEGVPLLYTGGAPQEYKGVKFRGVTVYHGVGCFDYNSFNGIEADGIRLWHTGDAGPVLSNEQVAAIGRVDILMTNWDNESMQMTQEVRDKVIKQLRPKVVIPMHHVHGPDEHMKSFKGGFTEMDTSEMEFKAGSLPSETKVILFKSPLKEV